MSANTGVWKGFRQQRPGSGASEFAEKTTAAGTKHSEPAVGLVEDQGLDLEEAEASLRQFDMASKYGPCRGISRLERRDRVFGVTLGYRMELFETKGRYVLSHIRIILRHIHFCSVAGHPLAGGRGRRRWASSPRLECGRS